MKALRIRPDAERLDIRFEQFHLQKSAWLPMRAFYALLRMLAGSAAFLFILAGCMLTYEVSARYLFVAPTIWAAELSQLCLIWGSMIGMPWLLKANQHIAVDALTIRLGDMAQRVCRVLAMSAIALFSAIVTWKGGEIFLDSFERGRTTGSMLDLPTWISELAIPVGFALLFVQAVIELGSAIGRRDLEGGTAS